MPLVPAFASTGTLSRFAVRPLTDLQFASRHRVRSCRTLYRRRSRASLRLLGQRHAALLRSMTDKAIPGIASVADPSATHYGG